MPMNKIDFPLLYADLCNIVARLLYDIPEDDPFMHTSKEARAATNAILEVLDNHGIVVPTE